MAYSLKGGRPVGDEVRRLIDKQLTLARACLERIGDSRSAHEIHEARRHVKKVRALIRLVRPALGNDYGPMNRRLRGMLGEHHNCALLIEVLLDPGLVSPREAAHVVRRLRRVQMDLRRRALAAGAPIYKEKPGEFVTRVKRLWKRARTRSAASAPDRSRESWPQVA